MLTCARAPAQMSWPQRWRNRGQRMERAGYRLVVRLARIEASGGCWSERGSNGGLLRQSVGCAREPSRASEQKANGRPGAGLCSGGGVATTRWNSTIECAPEYGAVKRALICMGQRSFGLVYAQISAHHKARELVCCASREYRRPKWRKI